MNIASIDIRSGTVLLLIVEINEIDKTLFLNTTIIPNTKNEKANSF